MKQIKHLSDLREPEILKVLQRFCPAEIIGDDGAVLAWQNNKDLVVTTDVLVDTVHFSDRTTPAKMAGWRAVAANLSDLAAMGATPVSITVGLSLPPKTELRWLEDLYAGIGACLQTYDTPLVGGDITRSPVKTIAITALGAVSKKNVIRRNTAQVGDVIIATGFHGDSRAGLELLLNPETGRNLTVGDRQYLILAHQKPLPRLDVSAYLNDIETDRNFAGMDSSDGLADAVLQLCEMSQAGAVLNETKIPISHALSRYQSLDKALQWTLYGGEDFELVLCMRRSPAEMLVQKFGKGCSIIGEITADKTVRLIRKDGRSQTLSRQNSFQHF
ncbi:thiamine-phosphate kinase [[Leptolyngbya] sp. PCC 7376]|uniref:thiamine-phosphate kinase n=1 Tax=[Leptolyngbya] sp. PCC 7376 TaxID=111781 RepID=UPI00029EE745|nr:thiamine-phosphate kinase [[Leptolyngbya] sp. PCC 7376]AFY39523.1 thiamine-phosphate kinase [[Leptolyngbya] sp. PCC 7376]